MSHNDKDYQSQVHNIACAVTFTACVQTALLSISKVLVGIVPHKRQQSGVVEETNALHPMCCNEKVNTQLGDIANRYTGLTRGKRDSQSVKRATSGGIT